MSHLGHNTGASMVVVIVFVAAANVAGAQDRDGATVDERLLRCDVIEDQAQRLACFNRVVESIQSPPPDTDEADPTTAITDTVPERPDRTDDRVSQGPPKLVPDHPLEDIVANPGATDEAPEGSEIAGETADIEAESPEDDAQPATEGIIVDVWQNHDGRFTVKLDNGQYWRETHGTRVGMPEAGDNVTIMRGFFGGYRMKIESLPQIAWVRQPE